MYAVVEILGQQFKAEAGKKLLDNEGVITVGAPTVEGAKIVCEVLSHVRGDKVIVFHKKRRKGYKKRNGHRQNFTEILVKEIVA